MPITHAEINGLRRQCAALWEQAKPHVQTLNDAAASDIAKQAARESFDRLDAEITQLTEQIKAEEDSLRDSAKVEDADAERRDRHARIEKILGESAGRVVRSAEDPEAVSDAGVGYKTAFLNVLKHGRPWCREHMPDSLATLDSQRGDLQRLSEDHPEVSAVLSSGVDSSLGYLVPVESVQNHVEASRFNGGLLETGITRMSTDHGRDIPWTLEDDTASEGKYLQEGQSHSGGKAPTVRKRFLRSHTLSSLIVRAPVQLLQDLSTEQFESWIFTRFTKRISRRRNRALIEGSGNGEPNGVQKRLPVKYTTGPGQTNTLTYTDFLRLEDQLDIVHRAGAELLFSPSVLTALKLETDLQNRPLWQPSVAVGQPNTFNNYPYKLDSYMPTLAPGNVVVAFGQFDAYVYREVTRQFVVTFRERFMDDGDVGFLMFVRHDGDLMDAGDNPLVGLQMASV